MPAQIGTNSMDQTVAMLAQRVEGLLGKFSSQPDRRIMIALAGVPGSGKSTVSGMLLEKLRQNELHNVVVIPMVCAAEYLG